MSGLLWLCCARSAMGAGLSQPHDGEAVDGSGLPVAPPTMADVIRERKKKAGGAGLGTLRRRIAAAARRPRDSRPDRGCEHARFLRSVVSSWRLAEVFVLSAELEAQAALRDLTTQADLAREPAPALSAALAALYTQCWWCDVELSGGGWSVRAHRAILHARSAYFRELLHRYSGACVVPLEGVAASLTRDELQAAVCALYSGTAHAQGWERNTNMDEDLDIINVDNNTCVSCGCCSPGARIEAARVRRLAAMLGCELDALHRDVRYLLDSGELSDARLVFRAEGCSGSSTQAYGFRTALDLPCHRLVLAARSRFFRSVMSRRSSCSGGSSAVCVDEAIVPPRYARALLHAAYTDQVDLSLVSRASTSPSSTTTAGSNNTTWGAGRRGTSAHSLEDAFQLYEIGRFLEMPIVVQGCEDVLVEALSPDTLPQILRWSAASHASQWVHRQAMRYLRDEFPTVMAHASSARLPRTALADALSSNFLQASETQALRAVLRWGERTSGNAKQAPDLREPNIVWQAGGRSRRRRGECDASLLALVRTEHIPPDNELLHQAIRRGLPPAAEVGSAADAWLGRGAHRPARCFLPYLDEVKALLEDQAVPEAEVARIRRTRYLHRIPDTLYMVAAARNKPTTTSQTTPAQSESACVPRRVVCALRARLRELATSHAAVRALRAHAPDPAPVYTQIALRAVREMSLPDSCAELLLNDESLQESRESGGGECSGAIADIDNDPDTPCRTGTLSGSGSLRCASAGSLRSTPALHIPMDNNSRSNTCSRRDLASRTNDMQQRWWSVGVPDVALAPNANTHLLSAPQYSGGGVLQLDLGDGATHTPRPGSRAQRAAAHSSRHRDHSQGVIRNQDVRPRGHDDDLRSAIELSLIRAYSGASTRRSPALDVLQAVTPEQHTGASSRASPSALSGTPRHLRANDLHAQLSLSRSDRSTSPHDFRPYRRHDYRLEPQYGSGSSSRGPSPSNYA